MQLEGITERLILRPLEMADAEQIQELFPHWQIVRFLKNIVPWPYPPDCARQFCEEVALPQMARGETFHWTLRLKTDPAQLIGSINLKPAKHDNRGFWLGLRWQKHGFMSEACIWANDFWFDTLGFSVLQVSKAAKNLASRRVSEKQGMRLVEIKEKEYVCGRLPSEVWEITVEEWRAWKASQLQPQQ